MSTDPNVIFKHAQNKNEVTADENQNIALWINKLYPVLATDILVVKQVINRLLNAKIDVTPNI